MNDQHTEDQIQQQTKTYKGCSYIKGLTENISSLFKKYNSEAVLAQKSTNNVKMLHNNIKDKTPKMERSGLIYSMNCGDLYVGQTGQFLKKRMKQHERDQINRFKLKNKHHTSAISHTLATGHSFNYPNPKILHMEPTRSKRNPLEMMYIKKFQKNSVNISSETEKLSSAYHNLIITPQL